MNDQEIKREIELLMNHHSIKKLQKISTYQYNITFVIHDSCNIYSNIQWELTFYIPENYPYSPPKIKFLTSIYHLNIDKNGCVRMGMLQQQWTQISSLYTLIDELQNILQYPDTNYPADTKKYDLYINQKQKYIQNCTQHLHIKRPKASRIDSQGKAEIEQQLKGLNQMKLTHFQGLDFDPRLSMPSNLKSQTKYQNQLYFSGINQSMINPRRKTQAQFLSVDLYLKPKQIRKSRENCQSLIQIEEKSKQFGNTDSYQENGGHTNPIRSSKLMMKQSKLNSIAQSIRGEQASNIFDLSMSKDQKWLLNSKKSMIATSHKLLVSNLVQPSQQIHSTPKIKQNNFQKENKQQKQLINPLRPDIFYARLLKENNQNTTQKQDNKIQSLLVKIQTQIWTKIQSISQIQLNLKKSYVLKSTVLQRTFQTKLKQEIEDLQKLEFMQNQLKNKIVTDLINLCNV